MELIYLWIHKNAHDCIKNQEFNFSPIHRFRVDDKATPTSITYEKCENEINFMKSDKISNITAIVGSNGAGKSTLLSFIANNNCFDEMKNGSRSEAYYNWEYEHNKSIYVFKDNDEFVVYHNLKNELECDPIIKEENIIQNKNRRNYSQGLWNFRRQMIIYLSNSYYVPNELTNYSQGSSIYNVNLHLQSLNIIANRFYSHLFNFNQALGATSEIINYYRNEKTFQELLDVLYYAFLSNNKHDIFAGNFKNEIYVYFEDIKKITEKSYDEYEADVEYGGLSFNLSRNQFQKKLNTFFEFYEEEKLNSLQHENLASVLYFNLLFEIFFNNDSFTLPKLNLDKDIYSQLHNVFEKDSLYENWLKDIRAAEIILSEYKNYEDTIEKSDDLACQYQKIINIDNTNFYYYFEKIFNERKSYVLKYIRIKNLEMSSGERAMQNMFSWLALTAQIDDIMSINRENYTSKLLLIDEIDLYSHPDWQRKIIYQLVDTINKIEKIPVQIIITSHSPIILSDFPKQNIIYLHNNGETTFSDDGEHEQSFGANIYTLFNDAFFLENGVIGEYARQKILDVYDEIKPEGNLKHEMGYYQSFIDILGDNILKKEMQRIFNKKCGGQ